MGHVTNEGLREAGKPLYSGAVVVIETKANAWLELGWPFRSGMTVGGGALGGLSWLSS